MEPDRDNELPEVDDEEEDQPSTLHLSDVIDVIQNTDPSFEATIQQRGAAEMFNGGNALPGPSRGLQQPQARRINAYVRIVQQPAQKSLRFRYECEGRSAGAIPGANSTAEVKTYPTIEIVGYKGKAVVVVSCVTKDEPYLAHPHNLVGKDGCKKGVCTVEVNSDNMCISFSNLGIQCVKKKDIESALRIREEIRVDPFKKGFAHRNQPTSIDLNAVRLCFQAFLPENGRFHIPLKPVVSDIIYDKKAMSDLVICKMSHCSASCAGGQEIILLCEKVAKDDILIKFSDDCDDPNSWVGWGDFQQADVHKQVAITFRSPRYKTLEIDQPVKVFIQLIRKSDQCTSEPRPFEMLPIDSDPIELKRKRQRIGGDPQVIEYLRNLQPPNQDLASADPVIAQGMFPGGEPSMRNQAYHNMLLPDRAIKPEPRDQPSSPYGAQQMHYRTVQGTPSPQPYNTPVHSPDCGSEGWMKTPLHNPTFAARPPLDPRQAYRPSLIDMDNQAAAGPSGAYGVGVQFQDGPQAQAPVNLNWPYGPDGRLVERPPEQPPSQAPQNGLPDLDGQHSAVMNSTEFMMLLGGEPVDLMDSLTLAEITGESNVKNNLNTNN